MHSLADDKEEDQHSETCQQRGNINEHMRTKVDPDSGLHYLRSASAVQSQYKEAPIVKDASFPAVSAPTPTVESAASNAGTTDEVTSGFKGAHYASVHNRFIDSPTLPPNGTFTTLSGDLSLHTSVEIEESNSIRSKGMKGDVPSSHQRKTRSLNVEYVEKDSATTELIGTLQVTRELKTPSTNSKLNKEEKEEGNEELSGESEKERTRTDGLDVKSKKDGRKNSKCTGLIDLKLGLHPRLGLPRELVVGDDLANNVLQDDLPNSSRRRDNDNDKNSNRIHVRSASHGHHDALIRLETTNAVLRSTVARLKKAIKQENERSSVVERELISTRADLVVVDQRNQKRIRLLEHQCEGLQNQVTKVTAEKNEMMTTIGELRRKILVEEGIRLQVAAGNEKQRKQLEEQKGILFDRVRGLFHLSIASPPIDRSLSVSSFTYTFLKENDICKTCSIAHEDKIFARAYFLCLSLLINLSLSLSLV